MVNKMSDDLTITPLFNVIQHPMSVITECVL